jgi:apolipoprotein N-acyltransferase
MLEIGGDWQSYKKHQLVPFGEYMPVRWVLKLFSRFVDIPMSDMAAGELRRNPFELAGTKVATSICYEMAYPDVLRAQMGGAELMLNTSNDAWFGDSFAAHQHLEMARVRAKEFAKPIVRATNNGVTAVITSEGLVAQKIEQFQPDVLRGQVRLNSVLTWFARVGQMIVSIMMLALLILLRIKYKMRLGE